MDGIWTEISFDIVTLYGPDFQLNNISWCANENSEKNEACFYDPVNFEGLESLSDENFFVTVG